MSYGVSAMHTLLQSYLPLTLLLFPLYPHLSIANILEGSCWHSSKCITSFTRFYIQWNCNTGYKLTMSPIVPTIVWLHSTGRSSLKCQWKWRRAWCTITYNVLLGFCLIPSCDSNYPIYRIRWAVMSFYSHTSIKCEFILLSLLRLVLCQSHFPSQDRSCYNESLSSAIDGNTCIAVLSLVLPPLKEWLGYLDIPKRH